MVSGSGPGMGEPSTDYHMHVDNDTFICCPVPVDSTLAGVFVTDRLARLDGYSQKNFALAILCLVYIGVNLVCTIINSMPDDWREAHDLPFHLLEFWATFGFSCVQVYSLVFSPRSLGTIYRNPAVLKSIVFFNVVATFVPAALVSVSLEAYEVASHEMEYANEITMAFVDLILFVSLAKKHGCSLDGTGFNMAVAFVTLAIAFVQLGIYNFLGGLLTEKGEQVAHFFEFAFETLSALISFLFCMDNKLICDERLRQLLSLDTSLFPKQTQSCCRGRVSA